MTNAAAGEFTKGVAGMDNRPLKEIEKEVILARLQNLNMNRTHTAKSLKIGIRTLQRKLKRYGLSEVAVEGSADATNEN